MFAIHQRPDGVIVLEGRLDAQAVGQARPVLAAVGGPCRVDCADLDYVSSAGIGLLVATQRRLLDRGASLQLENLTAHVRELLRLAGLEHVFDLGEAGGNSSESLR